MLFPLQKTHEMSFSQDTTTTTADVVKPSTSHASNDSDYSGDRDTEIENVIAAKKKRVTSPPTGAAQHTATNAATNAGDDDGGDDESSSVLVKIPKLTRSRSKNMEKKPKCKFWDKCYRKNADHLSEFLHPHDVLSDTKGSIVSPFRRVYCCRPVLVHVPF